MAITNAEKRRRYAARHPERVKESNRKYDRFRLQFRHAGTMSSVRFKTQEQLDKARAVLAHMKRKGSSG